MQNPGHLNGSAHAQLEEKVFGCNNIAVWKSMENEGGLFGMYVANFYA